MARFAHAVHPLVVKARDITRAWYQPHPGIRQHDHAIAETLTTHIADIDPELIAAAVIAHSFALAPDEIELEDFLTEQLSPRIAAIVTTLDSEYHAITADSPARSMYLRLLIHSNPEAAQISTADKIVLLTKLGSTAIDLGQYRDQILAALHAYYRFFHHYATPLLPPSLAAALAHLINTAPTIGEPDP